MLTPSQKLSQIHLQVALGPQTNIAGAVTTK